MPGPALHHMIADRLKADIALNKGLGPDADYGGLLQLLANDNNLPYLFVGCHGPDPFFFNAEDMPDPLGAFVDTYTDLSDLLHDFKELVLSAVPEPVLDALSAFDEAANAVIADSSLLTEIEQTFADIDSALGAVVDTITEAVKRYVTDFNLFGVIDHPYRDGAEANTWWWFDAMHYRRTGEFATALLERTRDLEQGPEHLYAIGYLTHVAADTVGHPYVNLNSGGAYRSHGQRHKTGENFQDAYNLRDETGLDFNYSKLHALYNFEYDGTVTEEEPHAHPRMPDRLAQLISDALNDVYRESGAGAQNYATKISPEIVGDTYQVWYRFMRGFTQTSTLPPPRTYSLTAELKEVWEQALSDLDEAGDFLKNFTDETSDLGILSLFLSLGAAIIAGIMAARAIAKAVVGAVATLGTATIRYLACLIYEQLYTAFMDFRLAIALNGLGWPMAEHLSDPRFKQFIAPAFDDATGVSGVDAFDREPLRRHEGFDLFNQERHLVYPLTDGERRTVAPAPRSYLPQLPTYDAWGDISPDDGLVADLASLQHTGASEEDQWNVTGDRVLGNAMDLTRVLYERFARGETLPDFNLDADRGYAYLCWSQPGEEPHEPRELDVTPEVRANVL